MNTSNEDLGASYLSHQLHDNSIFNPGDDGSEDSRDGDDEKPTGVLREQDRFLPIANVARIMKRSIPKTGKIAKEARDCVQECVSEFVSFITSEASDRCHQEKRKTINGEDILYAMSSLGFDNYVEPLKVYLQKYRELNKTDKGIIALSGEGGSPSSTSAVASSSASSSSAIGRDPLETTPVTQISSSQGQASSNTVVFAYDLGGN